MNSRLTLELYSTLACHLCDHAKAMLDHVRRTALPEDLRLEIEIIDIANDPSLFECYGLRIPVIAVPGMEQELGWPFEIEQLVEYIQRASDFQNAR